MSRRLQLRNVLAVVILALATTLTLFIVSNMRGNAPEEVLDSLPKNVDLSLKKIHYTETREGRQAWTLVADSASHNMSEGVGRIENIHMTFFDPKLGDLSLTADHGRVLMDQREVAASGHVELKSPRGYTFLTQGLDYREADHTLRSTGPVKLVSSGLRVEGRRLQLNVENRSLVLSGQVRADFPDGLNGIPR